MQRIQWTRYAGQPLPEDTKLITRPGRFGNPWKVGPDGNRAEVINRFARFLVDRSQEPGIDYPSDEEIVRLGGLDLACACDHSGPCHGDVLIARIELLKLVGSVR